jgi:hypothetical protein
MLLALGHMLELHTLQNETLEPSALLTACDVAAVGVCSAWCGTGAAMAALLAAAPLVLGVVPAMLPDDRCLRRLWEAKGQNGLCAVRMAHADKPLVFLASEFAWVCLSVRLGAAWTAVRLRSSQ